MGLTLNSSSLNLEAAGGGGAAGLSTADVNTLIQNSAAWEYITTYEITSNVVSVDITGSDVFNWDLYDEIWISGRNIINNNQVQPYFKLNNYSCYYVNRFNASSQNAGNSTTFYLETFINGQGVNFDIKVRWDGTQFASMTWQVDPTYPGYPQLISVGQAATSDATSAIDTVTLGGFYFTPDKGKNINIYGLRKKTV